MPPTETSKDIMNVIFTDRLSSNIYFFCKKKLKKIKLRHLFWVQH